MANRPTSELRQPDSDLALCRLERRLVERRTPEGARDPVARSRYVGRYESELAGALLAPSDAADLERALAGADVILLGEYHPLAGAALHAEALLSRLVAERGGVGLGLEFAQGRDQRCLDAYLAGRVNAAELRERIAYDREWGYPWEPAERLLDRARSLGVRAHGLDVAPRGGVRDLRVRDRVVGRRLAGLLVRGEGPLVVLFGEAHLAEAHLPASLRASCEREGLRPPRVVRVFHDLPAAPGPERGSVFRVGPDTFVSFPEGPEARAGALARVWQAWARATPVVRLEDEALLHALARMQLDALGLDARRVELPQGRVLADLFPCLMPLEDPREPSSRLTEEGLAESEARARIARALGEGALFVEEAGVVLAHRRDVTALARAAGAFCASALAEVAAPREGRRTPAGESLLEAAGWALARLADPVVGPNEDERERDWMNQPGVPRDAGEARLLGGALAREIMRARLPASTIRRALRAANLPERAGVRALEALVTRVQNAHNERARP